MNCRLALLAVNLGAVAGVWRGSTIEVENATVSLTKGATCSSSPKLSQLSADGSEMVEYFTDYRSFHKARECCQGRGGDLLTVKTSEMNDLAQGMQDTEKEWNHAWIGLRSEDGEGYVWVDGTEPVYRKFGIGQPHSDNGMGVVLRWTSGTWATVAKTEWRRYFCAIPVEGVTASPVAAPEPESVCPADGPKRSIAADSGATLEYFGSFYTWANSRACCEERGGDLAVVKDATFNAECQNIQDTEKEWNHAWTGLSNVAGSWKWVDGTVLNEFHNFGVGQPAGDSTGKAIVLRWTSGTWASVAESEMRRFLCEIPPPTESPTPEPTEAPTPEPTEEPTKEPTEAPTEEPTKEPTEAPTEEPTKEPTEAPTPEPTEEPTKEPTEAPTEEPTKEPTEAPTEEPTKEPTEAPTPEPIHCPAGGPTGVAPGLLYFTDGLNHADAELCCQERGGSLAVMTDASLNGLAEALLKANLQGAAYLGEPTDGYTNWDPTAPKKTGVKFAPTMRRTGKWAMVGKKVERSFFCSF